MIKSYRDRYYDDKKNSLCLYDMEREVYNILKKFDIYCENDKLPTKAVVDIFDLITLQENLWEMAQLMDYLDKRIKDLGGDDDE